MMYICMYVLHEYYIWTPLKKNEKLAERLQGSKWMIYLRNVTQDALFDT